MSFDLFGDTIDSSTDFNTDELVFEAFTTDADTAYADVVAAESYLTNCERASLGLESLFSNITSTLDRGMSDGMTDGEASFAFMAAEGYLSLVTSNAAQVLRGLRLPAVESFDSTASRRLNTVYASESIKSALGEIWKKIRDFVMKFVDMISKFWVEHLGAAKRLQEAAAKLKKKAGESSLSNFKENKLNISGSMYTHMLYDNTVSPDKIVNGLSAFGKDLQAATGDKLEDSDLYKFVDWLEGKTNFSKMSELKDLETKLNNEKGDMFNADKRLNYLKGQFKLGELKGDKRYKESDTVDYLKSSNKLMGDKVLIVTVSKTDSKTVKSTKFELTWDKSGYTVPDTKSVEAMNSSNIEKVSEAVEEVCKDIIKYQTDIPKRRKLVDKAKSVGDALVKSIDAIESKDTKSSESISFYAAEVVDLTRPDGYKSAKTDGDTGYSKDDVSAVKKQMKAFVNQFATNAKSIYEPGLSYQKQAFDSAKASFAYAAKCFGNLKKD